MASSPARVSPSGDVTTLYDFTGTGPDAGLPENGLVYDAAHRYMWGTTRHDNGVFRYRDGVVESITHLPGWEVERELALGPDGVHFYTFVDTQVWSGRDDRHDPVRWHPWQGDCLQDQGLLTSTSSCSSARESQV